MITGLHHITATASDPEGTLRFYTRTLGLRLVKRTINFDTPSMYHFYFGNGLGAPGTLLTFFPVIGTGTGMRGTSQATKIQLAVPMGSFGFWVERFRRLNVRTETIAKRFGRSTLRFYDEDGLQLELVMTDEQGHLEPWTGGHDSIPEETAVRGLFGVEVSVREADESARVVEHLLDYTPVARERERTRYRSRYADCAAHLDIVAMPAWPRGKPGAGTVHHVAFRTTEPLEEIRPRILEAAAEPTPVVDRAYFRSIYFREPAHILYEIATDGPGFLIDEERDELGATLKLPPHYESRRDEIVATLPDVFDR
ncbi:MAG: VOC family protein [Spirochaetales bacterium]|nr:VOC family protein [Spirochaetales bacterium]